MERRYNKSQGRLTNEEISKKFTNQFELVLYAIKLAENMIRTGRDPRVKTDTQNKAMTIVQEIINGKDVFDEVAKLEVETAFRNKKSD